MDCKPTCEPYIPERKFDDIKDLKNPFITRKDTCKCKNKKPKVFKLLKKSKDETLIILCFILFLLITYFLF